MNLTERQYRKGNAMIASGTAIRMAGVKQALMTDPAQENAAGMENCIVVWQRKLEANNIVF